MAGAGVGTIRPFQSSSEGAPGSRRWAARGFLFVGALVVSDLAEQVGQAGVAPVVGGEGAWVGLVLQFGVR